MSQKYAQLVLFTTVPEEESTLREYFQACANIVVTGGAGPEVTSRFHLDALWMTPMQASYYGVSPATRPEFATIMPMPKELRTMGLPRLLISGVNLIPGKVYTAKLRARLPALCLAKAVAEYNESHDQPIVRVGSIPENLGLDSSEENEARRAIRGAFAGVATGTEHATMEKIRQPA